MLGIRLIAFAMLALPMWTCAVGRASADVFELTGGGRIEGKMVEATKGNKAAYVIELASGGRITIARSQVAKIETSTPLDAEYQKLARSSPDNVEAHWKLAEWCRERKMRNESQQHLARIIELNPNHAQARAALGFKQKDGNWLKRDDIMASRGLVLYEGHYVAPQHIELLEQQKKARITAADWSSKIERLRRALTGRHQDRAAQAHAEIVAIDDPAAADAVVKTLDREKDPQLRKLWIEVASRLDSPLTVQTLVQLSLNDPDPEIRHDCLEYLVKSQRPGLVTPFVKALRNNDNDMINRAGEALGEIGDTDAIGPLIDALVTTHKIKVSDANPDQHSYAFTPDGGGGGFSFGGGGPKSVSVPVKNPAVLSALVKLSGGASFDYDKAQWRSWLAAQAKLNAVDLRRDQ